MINIDMEFILQISYGDLISWIMLTLVAVIILSVMYRFATQNRTSSDNGETMETEINKPQNFTFISADIEESISLLKNAHIEYEKNKFNETVKKIDTAISLVLSQLLGYFNVQNEESSVENKLQILDKKGVIFSISQQDIARLDEIFKKANEDKLVTKEEIRWVFHISGHIIEYSKEARIKE